MLTFGGRGILLDIEGTTASIHFVYDVLFPFARQKLDSYLHSQWESIALREACDQIARDAGWSSWPSDRRQLAPTELRQRVRSETLRRMDVDAKTTGLKQLQGLIWQSGFESGELLAVVFDDVPAALSAWQRRGLDVRIYSSGSVLAQRLFFRHTSVGDLTKFLRGYYDTTSGSKKESTSYERIAADIALPPAEILFVSDITAELDAATEAGLQTALCQRAGNAPPPPNHGHPVIGSLAEIEITG